MIVSDSVNVNRWMIIGGGLLREAVTHGGSTVYFIVLLSTIPEHSFTGGNSSKGSGFLFLVTELYNHVGSLKTSVSLVLATKHLKL